MWQLQPIEGTLGQPQSGCSGTNKRSQRWGAFQHRIVLATFVNFSPLWGCCRKAHALSLDRVGQPPCGETGWWCGEVQ